MHYGKGGTVQLIKTPVSVSGHKDGFTHAIFSTAIYFFLSENAMETRYLGRIEGNAGVAHPESYTGGYTGPIDSPGATVALLEVRTKALEKRVTALEKAMDDLANGYYPMPPANK